MTIRAATLSLSLLLAGSLSAQNDWIQWTDGSRTTGITVQEFDIKNIKYRDGGKTELRTSDLVEDLYVEQVFDRYKRAFGATASEKSKQFVTLTDKFKDDALLFQFGFWEAYKTLRSQGDTSQAFSALDELAKSAPESGFVARTFSEKIDEYLGRGSASSAGTVAKRYQSTAKSQSYPKGFQLEADYYIAVVESMGAEDPAAKKGEFERIQQEANVAFPDVSSRARLQIANILRTQKQNDEARAIYEELVALDAIGPDVRGGAWLGLGFVNFDAGDPTNKQPYFDALVAFLRVYVENRAAGDAVVAEALHNGAIAAERWGGPSAATVNRRLLGRLRREFPDWQPGN